jgi:hypothetical protein
MILNWKTGSPIRRRLVPVVAKAGPGGYVPPATERPGFQNDAGMARGSAGQPIAARSCSYSEIITNAVRSS